nr:putative ribonuclease H-like domain-containing protein [Tanacetum cinerariifolium]
EESLAQAKDAQTTDVQPKDAPAKGIQYIKRYHGYKKKPQSESQARKNMIDYLKNTEEIEKEEEEIIKSINETPAQKAAKRRRLREQAKKAKDLKKQLEVVADEDDDVFVEATPIGTKVSVVNYEIVMINNKPRYKIFRADDTHQLYTSFITLLKNFDREDLEDLWKIIKARFSTSKPTNWTDDYLLATLKNMFEKTDAQDVLWKSQQTEHGQALVKSWKLLTSCGVHIITFTTTMFILLVEKKYPLSRFTLEQLVNVARLQVEEETSAPKDSSRNISYLSDFEVLNGGYVAFGGNPKGCKITGKGKIKTGKYVAFGGNPKGGKITGKGKIKTGKLDFDDVYYVKELKFNLFSVSQMCGKKNNVLFTDTECLVLSSDFKLSDASSGPAWLFDIDSLSQTMNYHLVLAENQSNPTVGFQDAAKAGEEGTQTYVLFPVLSNGSTNPKNNKDAHTGGNKYNDDIQKSVSSSCGDQAKEQDDKAVNKDKGKSPAVTITGFRDLNEEFADCINNSRNGVSTAGPSVSAAGLKFTNSTNDLTTADPLVSAADLNFTNNTNDVSAAGPSNAAMPNLEDLSHNADDVRAEADTNNMESVISVSPIPTTRIHKDHLISQIIGDLSSTTQTRSMARKVRDQGGISQMFNEDFHTCMFACFLSQEEPKRIHQALKDPS